MCVSCICLSKAGELLKLIVFNAVIIITWYKSVDYAGELHKNQKNLKWWSVIQVSSEQSVIFIMLKEQKVIKQSHKSNKVTFVRLFYDLGLWKESTDEQRENKQSLKKKLFNEQEEQQNKGKKWWILWHSETLGE